MTREVLKKGQGGGGWSRLSVLGSRPRGGCAVALAGIIGGPNALPIDVGASSSQSDRIAPSPSAVGRTTGSDRWIEPGPAWPSFSFFNTSPVPSGPARFWAWAVVLICAAILALSPLPSLAADGKKPCDLTEPLPSALYQTLAQVHKLYDQGKYEAALARLTPSRVGAGRNHYRFFFMRGLLGYQLHRLPQAEADLARAVELKPCFFQAVYNLAAVQYERGEFSAAAHSALKAFELSDPPDPEILYLAGAAYLSARRPDLAEPVLARLTARKDPRPDWFRALIKARLDRNKRAAAKATARKFLALWPGDAEMWRLLAGLEASDKKYASAAADLKVALGLEPGRPDDRRLLAQLYQSAGAPLAAAGQYRRLWGDKPTGQQLDRLAQLYIQGRRFDLAGEMLTRAVDQQPTAERYTRLAEVNLQQRDYAAARKAYLAASSLSQGPAAARSRLAAAQCALHLGRYGRAEEDYRAALGLAENDPALKRQAESGLETARGLMAYWQDSK